MNPQQEQQPKMETEQKEFIDWCKKMRKSFESGMVDKFNWFNLKSEQRVIVEDLLLCFDQLVQRQEHSYSEQEQWVSVKDRLPDINGEYLCFTTYSESEPTIDSKTFFNGMFKTIYTITHWMPLPAPPKQ